MVVGLNVLWNFCIPTVSERVVVITFGDHFLQGRILRDRFSGQLWPERPTITNPYYQAEWCVSLNLPNSSTVEAWMHETRNCEKLKGEQNCCRTALRTHASNNPCAVPLPASKRTAGPAVHFQLSEPVPCGILAWILWLSLSD